MRGTSRRVTTKETSASTCRFNAGLGFWSESCCLYYHRSSSPSVKAKSPSALRHTRAFGCGGAGGVGGGGGAAAGSLRMTKGSSACTIGVQGDEMS
jgi:hypothetical protein